MEKRLWTLTPWVEGIGRERLLLVQEGVVSDDALHRVVALHRGLELERVGGRPHEQRLHVVLHIAQVDHRRLGLASREHLYL